MCGCACPGCGEKVKIEHNHCWGDLTGACIFLSCHVAMLCNRCEKQWTAACLIPHESPRESVGA